MERPFNKRRFVYTTFMIRHTVVFNTPNLLYSLLHSRFQDRFQVSRSLFHLYGHSLGAHVSGYAGEHLRGRISRITTLDSAQQYIQYMPILVRVDPSDAQFIEAIRTDARSFVTSLDLNFTEPIGHLDFFPNGGCDYVRM